MDVAIVTMLFGAFGLVIGSKVGTAWGSSAETNRQFWQRTALVLVVGIILSALVSATGLITLAGLVLGLVAGGIAGIKMGFGRSVGPWKKHDEVFRVNKDHLDAARAYDEAKQDGMTAKEREERPLISVDDTKDRH